MRKDVECTFGILKGRWRILKAGIRLQGLDAADMVWKTCCALHNYLLEIDGYDTLWNNGTHSDWEGILGQFDLMGIEEVPVLKDLNNPEFVRTYDESGMGYGNDHIDDDDDCTEEYTEDNHVEESDIHCDDCMIVRKLPFHLFRMKLVTHFNIALQRKEVKWPQKGSIRN
jgi:hypothetical protein